VSRHIRNLRRIARGAGLIARGLADREHPLLAHVVPIRRCNLDCGYCNEYDKVSAPLPAGDMLRRLDCLIALKTEAVAFSGGEPLLHPQLDSLITHLCDNGVTPGLLTNGYLLSEARIDALNRAGLEYMQVSIDNIEPDDVSKKSLRLLDQKLQWLASHALFDVNINTVLGSGVRNPEDALTIVSRARELGLSTSIGIIHEAGGHLKPLSEAEQRVWKQVRTLSRHGRWLFKNLYSGLVKFEENLIAGRPNEWRCRAGARYLYVCEEGLVHYCSQQRGTPGIPIERYTREDIRREYATPKACAPACTIGCVHRVSIMDFWRDPQSPATSDREPADAAPPTTRRP
jgi:MoaA/NifB/PqqE/SkfB family radical SAM enzyme